MLLRSATQAAGLKCEINFFISHFEEKCSLIEFALDNASDY